MMMQLLIRSSVALAAAAAALLVHGQAVIGVHGSSAAVGVDPPALPLQFRADVSVLSHLTDPRQAYPPSEKRMSISYDFTQKAARAEMLRGYDKGKTYVRRYDQKREYMVKNGKYKKCERAYLGEEMPPPEIPFEQQYVAIEKVRGVICEHWIHSYSNVRVHVFADAATKVPIRLTQENYIKDTPTMLLTFDLHNIELGPQNMTNFDIPGGYEHKECMRNVGGFPYIHAFHYYLRF